MNLDANLLSTYQRCNRRHVLERDWRPIRWRPKSLLETALRSAILELSNGADVMITSQKAATKLLDECAHAGMDTPYDSYVLAKDYCAILYTVLEWLSRMTLLTIKPGGIVPLGETEHCWRLSAFQDESGILHRWTVVDKWDTDTQYRELHSWQCFGDCAAANSGMMLHVIEIGRVSNSHQHTDWARCYKHPAIHNHFRFRKVDGSKLEKSWIPVWFQGSDFNDPKVWVDLMLEDKLQPIHHIEINLPDKKYVRDFHAQVDFEAGRIRDLGAWDTVPLSRAACDVPYMCPWQYVCYAPPGVVNIDSIGGYARL